MPTPNIPGAGTVVSWFGEWPAFHDAEIMSVLIARGERSKIRVKTWITRNHTDAEGYFVREREVVVTFELKDIVHLRLEGEDADRQNVLAGIVIEQVPGGYRLDLVQCYGLAGEISVKELSVRLEPSPGRAVE